MTQLIEFLRPMLHEDEPHTVKVDSETLRDEQTYLARIVHLILNDDPNENFRMLETFKDELLQGGNARVIHTVPALVYAYIKLSRYIHRCSQHAQSQTEEQHNENDELNTTSETKASNRKPKYFKGEITISQRDLFNLARTLIQRIVLFSGNICLRLNLSLVSAINEVSVEKEVNKIILFFTIPYQFYFNSMMNLFMKSAQRLSKFMRTILQIQIPRFDLDYLKMLLCNFRCWL